MTPEFLGRLRQPRDQRHAIDQLHGAAVHREVQQVAAKASADMQQRLERAGHAEKRHEVRAGHDRHAHERGLAHGLAQAMDQRPHFPAIVWRGDHLMPLRRGARHVAVHVGNRVAVDKLKRGVLFEERHHARSVVEESIDARRIVPIPQLVPQIGPRLFRVLVDARALRERIAWHPHPSARPGRRAAEHRVFLDDDDLSGRATRR